MFMVHYFDEVWLIGSDRKKDKIPDLTVVHLYQAGGVPTVEGFSNADVKLLLAFVPTRPAA